MIPCEQKVSLMRKAAEKYGDNISLCGPTKSWDDCFTIENGEILFWFNVGKDTHMISEKKGGDTS